MAEWPGWSDEQFLGYCYIHSETPRALFSAEQIIRLCKLAKTKVPEIPDSTWHSVHARVVHPLVQRARMLKKLTVLEGGKNGRCAKRS